MFRFPGSEIESVSLNDGLSGTWLRQNYNSIHAEILPTHDILFVRSLRLISRSKITLVKDANLIVFKDTDNRMHQTSVMEENQIVLLPAKRSQMIAVTR